MDSLRLVQEADYKCLKKFNLIFLLFCQFDLERERAPVVIITSTTGTGDLPDTATKFFQEVSGILAPHHYAHIKYAVLGKKFSDI